MWHKRVTQDFAAKMTRDFAAKEQTESNMTEAAILPGGRPRKSRPEKVSPVLFIYSRVPRVQTNIVYLAIQNACHFGSLTENSRLSFFKKNNKSTLTQRVSDFTGKFTIPKFTVFQRRSPKFGFLEFKISG